MSEKVQKAIDKREADRKRVAAATRAAVTRATKAEAKPKSET